MDMHSGEYKDIKQTQAPQGLARDNTVFTWIIPVHWTTPTRCMCGVCCTGSDSANIV